MTNLAPGKSRFAWWAGPEFFEMFGNTEILDAALEVTAELCNHGLTVDAACTVAGSVTVACDRCLGDLTIPVELSFGESYAPESDELDLRQDVYDYVCVSLPIQRVHPDGECDQETTKYLSK